jgi:hypothetical protein
MLVTLAEWALGHSRCCTHGDQISEVTLTFVPKLVRTSTVADHGSAAANWCCTRWSLSP